jgi:hypothetical protein
MRFRRPAAEQKLLFDLLARRSEIKRLPGDFADCCRAALTLPVSGKLPLLNLRKSRFIAACCTALLTFGPACNSSQMR